MLCPDELGTHRGPALASVSLLADWGRWGVPPCVASANFNVFQCRVRGRQVAGAQQSSPCLLRVQVTCIYLLTA